MISEGSKVSGMTIKIQIVQPAKVLCYYYGYRESPRETASRECAEETFGVLGGSQHLLQLLKDYQSNNVFKVRLW